jgi:hypothetical protein
MLTHIDVSVEFKRFELEKEIHTPVSTVFTFFHLNVIKSKAKKKISFDSIDTSSESYCHCCRRIFSNKPLAAGE